MADEQTPQSDDLPEGDQDALFDQTEGNDGAGDGGTNVHVAPEVLELLGEAASETLTELATQAADVLTVGLDSVAGQRTVLVDAALSVTDYAAIEREYASVDHMGFEVRVAFTPNDSQLAVMLVPLVELGALLSLDLPADQLAADEAFAATQTEAVAAAIRQLLDLMSLTLFTGPLQGIEATLSELRVGQIEYTMGILGDIAHGAPAVRIQLALARTDGSVVAILLVLPDPLVRGLVERLVSGTAEDIPAAEPTPLRPRAQAGAPVGASVGRAEEPRGFGLSDDPGSGPRAGGYGLPPGDDVDVHPVRFPTLPPPATQMASRSLDLIMDVSMRVTVELGRSTMTVEDVLALGPGSVVELNKLAGEPVDILVNEQLIARGEVVVVDENFGVRVTEIVSPRRRARAMGE